ncbi:hypothetical protein R3X26_03325 [Vibrio sp. TH_r3]|uniref:hypothetical protein n=1 Tax=Vibrio sp. TH_r3 TaxID=3082084 RepID=UPI002953A42A|nr:hypothetical protein [Vibrio sp. TH_r3]MDV7103433.1 hypothetical protein [Vibrio sp. TH_r3]
MQLFIAVKVHACDFFYASEMLQNTSDPSLLCSQLIQADSLELDPLDYSFSSEQNQKNEDYWSNWAIEVEDSPFVTGQLNNNYLGVGIWTPSGFDDTDSEMEYRDWLLSHGLQFSVGLGEPNGQDPRMRVDYRWHKNQAADVMFQIELPF